MKIVFVAFNHMDENSKVYRKYKTIKGALKQFEECLKDPSVEFFSIRKVGDYSDIK